MWDDDCNCHLFTLRALEDALKLLMLMADHSMHMALLKGIPTLESMVTKNWTHPDNVFCSGNLVNKIVFCTTDLRLQGPSTDHVSIQTALEFSVAQVPDKLGYNFWAVNWETFLKELEGRLMAIPGPESIGSKVGFDEAVSGLTEALQGAIQEVVP